MPLSLNDFLERLRRSRLIREDRLQALCDSLEGQSTTAEQLARELVRTETLTEYQAKRVYKGKTDLLSIGDYQILEQIGFGGMGQVFKAWHAPMARVVALKLLPEDSFESPQAVRRFRREVQASARLDHPNIVSAQNAGEVDGRQYFVMQYIEGDNLAERVVAKGPLDVSAAIDCVLQAARGLQHAHERGVIHRDIKPGNLLFGDDGVLRILDLGLARFRQGSEPLKMASDSASDFTRLTLPGQMLGTVEFASPEQAKDTREAGETSDIYSLGCTLYYLLVGSPPFEGDGIVAVLLAHASAPIPSIRSHRADAPAELDEILAKMMAKEPDDRFQTPAELIAALSPIVGEAAAPPSVGNPRVSPESKTVANGAKTSCEPSGRDTVADDSNEEGGDEFVVAYPYDTPTVSVSSDMTVAKWAIGIGGSVDYQHDGIRCHIDALDDLADPVPNLDAIDLAENINVSDADLQRFKQLKTVRLINLAKTSISDNGMRNLRGLRSLEELNLSGNKISGVGLAYLVTLQNLQELDVSNNRVDDKGLSVLARLRGLKRLVLANTLATDDGAQRLQTELPDCEIIR